jgi:amino acid adenylation domain-containing protein
MSAPLSHTQLGIWRAEQFLGASALHNEAVAFRLRGPLDVAALRAAVDGLAVDHDVLRVAFVTDPDRDEPRQVAADAVTIPVRLHDTTEARVPALLAELTAQPIDLAVAPLVRVHLLRTGPEEHVLLLVAHHLVADAWSVGTWLTGLGVRYRGGRPQPPTAAFLDHARAERAAGDDPDAVAYWRDRLAGDLPVVTLPADGPRPARPDLRGALHETELPAPLVARLAALSREHRVSLATTLLTAFTLAVHRFAGQDDVLVGMPMATRGRPGLADTGGPLLNMVACRTDVTGDPSFVAALARTRDTLKGALRHRTLPFERLVELLRPTRHAGYSPVFQLLLAVHNGPEVELDLPGVEATRVPAHNGMAKYDLSAFVRPDGEGGQRLTLEYRTQLFHPRTVARFAEVFRAVLDAAVTGPDRPVGDLPLLTADEQERFGRELPGPPPSETVLDLIAGHAPDRPAVGCAGAVLTYGELRRRAERIAAALPVGPGDRVAVRVDRGVDLVSLLLGIWRAGAVAVPLGAEHPPARTAHVVADSGARLVVADAELADLLAAPPRGPLPAPPAATDLAYLMYTSGSTGAPKGVAVPHGNLTNLLRSVVAEPGIPSDAVLLSVTALSFDISLLELLAPLVAGARVELLPAGQNRDGEAVAAALAASGATLMQATPSMWQLLLDSGWPGSRTLRAFCGGEPLTPALAEALLARVGELWNLYGPTETTIWSTVDRVRPGEPVTVGRPVAATYCRVVDGRGRPLPTGAVGELVIGGHGVAAGYWGRPELTATVFVDDPLHPGNRVYRTGDLARYLPDGRLALLGRVDQQIKIRGHRVELGEIESVLTGQPGVRQAVVVRQPDADRLVAFVVGDDPDPVRLRAELARHLPAVMVPAAFTVLPELPMTTNGKADRVALREAARHARPDSADLVAPRDATEAALVELCVAVLDVPAGSFGVTDDFLAAGGSSLSVTRLLARVRQELGVAVRLADFVAAPTVARLAELVRAATPASTPPPVPAGPGGVSSQQRQLWLVEQLHPGTAMYHLAARVDLTGPLDVAALAAAVDDLLTRHPVLRTGYASTAADPLRPVPADPAPGALRVVAATADDTDELVRAEAVRPFDLTRPPLLRATLLRRGDDDAVLVVVAHHIAMDGWSIGVAMADLAACYAHRAGYAADPPPPPAAQYAAYAAALDGEADLPYWLDRLKGCAGVLDLPADAGRPVVRDVAGAVREVVVPPALGRAVRELAARLHSTPFTVLLAAWAALLGRYADTGDVVVGVPTANRPDPVLEEVVGCFTNTLPVRVDVSGSPGLAELVRRTRDVVLTDLDHARVPFDRLVDALRLPRDPHRTPLVQAMLVYGDTPPPAPALPGVTSRLTPVDTGCAKYDLCLTLDEDGDGFRGRLEHATAVIGAETAGRLVEHLMALLAAGLADPDATLDRVCLGPVPPPAEPAAPPALVDLLVPADPDAVALRHEHGELTYGQLDAWAAEIAARLDVPAGRLVALLLPPGPVQVAAALAVLRVGRAFVVLDPRDPELRRREIVADADPACVVTTAALPPTGLPAVVVDPAPPAGPVGTPTAPPTAGPDCCLVYTSGSTGRPKGILLGTDAFAQFALWQRERFGIRPGSRIAQWAPFTYDAAYTEVFAALCAGATVCLPPEGIRRDPIGMARWLRAEGVTQIQTVPAFYRLLTEVAGGDLGRLEHVLLAGEVFPTAVAEAHPAGGWRLHNLYGPTECILATHREIVPGERYATSVPIGSPIDGRQALVLDARLRPCPVGVPGEIYLRSPYLAGGYHRRPAETATAYRPDPWRPGHTVYRTGDRGRWLPTGELEFLGRVDFQVKVRGNRVELGEIEARLAAHPGVREAAAAVHDQRLYAYAVLDDPAVTPQALREHLTDRMPAPSVPDAVLVVAELPRTATNKVDRSRLPRPDATPGPVGAEPVRSDLERVIADAWQQVLGAERPGRRTNFFEAGGNSLLAARLQVLLTERLGQPVRLVDVFAHPTIAELAGRLGGSSPAAAAPAAGTRGARRRAGLQSLARARKDNRQGDQT